MIPKTPGARHLRPFSHSQMRFDGLTLYSMPYSPSAFFSKRALLCAAMPQRNFSMQPD
jgi:hypothetical protein